MNTGWIKLYRSLLGWGWYDDHNVCRLFIHLLLTVNHKESEFKGHTISRGMRVFGLEKLSQETGLSLQEVRTSLAKLKSTGEIVTKSTNKFSILTVCNYGKFQDGENAEQQTSNKRATTSKERKKGRNTGQDLWKLPTQPSKSMPHTRYTV